MHFQTKVPDAGMKLRLTDLDFRFAREFAGAMPEAYERLLLDVLEGDASLFARSDEVELAWGIIDPIQQCAGNTTAGRRTVASTSRRLGGPPNRPMEWIVPRTAVVRTRARCLQRERRLSVVTMHLDAHQQIRRSFYPSRGAFSAVEAFRRGNR